MTTTVADNPFPEMLAEWAKGKPSVLRQHHIVTNLPNEGWLSTYLPDLLLEIAQTIYHFSVDDDADLLEGINQMLAISLILKELAERGVELDIPVIDDGEIVTLPERWAAQDAERGESPSGGFNPALTHFDREHGRFMTDEQAAWFDKADEANAKLAEKFSVAGS